MIENVKILTEEKSGKNGSYTVCTFIFPDNSRYTLYDVKLLNAIYRVALARLNK